MYCCNMYMHNKFPNLFILNFIKCQSCKDNFHSSLYCIMRWWNCNFFSPNNALLKSRHWLQYPKLEEIVCNIKTFTLTPEFSVPLNVRMQFSCTWKSRPHPPFAPIQLICLLQPLPTTNTFWARNLKPFAQILNVTSNGPSDSIFHHMFTPREKKDFFFAFSYRFHGFVFDSEQL